MSKETSKTVSVFTFGVGGRLVEGERLVYETMYQAHRYSNTLVEIERKRREAIRCAQRDLTQIAPYHDAVTAAKDRIDALYAELAEAKKTGRTRKVSSESRQAIALAKAELKAANEALRVAKASARDELKPLYEAVEERASAEQRAARAASNVYHSTYQLVEMRAKASRNALAKKLAPENDPRFRSFPRPYGARSAGIAEGRIGVITGGKHITVEEAFSGKNDWLRIGRVSPDAYYLPRGERSRATRTTVSFRVGSNPDRSPIWATFSDVIIHRELPADGKITMAWFKLRMLGDRASDRKWELQLTVESQGVDAARPEEHVCGDSVAAINVGWRAIEHGRRVAYLVDDRGREQEITYAPHARARARVDGGDRFAHADSIRSIRSKNFDVARDLVANFLEHLDGCPDWIAERATHLHQWRSSSRLASLVREWRSNRFDGDEAVFDAISAWMHQDAHLYQWETREVSRAINNRKQHYRTIAKAICERYGVILLGDIDLSQLAKKASPEDSEDNSTTDMRRARSRTAPSEFVAALRLFARKTATQIKVVSAVNITRACHACGFAEAWDSRASIEHKCSRCGSIWDQDANACRNMLKKFERFGDAEMTGLARKSETASDSPCLA